jgi:hypothetical protein
LNKRIRVLGTGISLVASSIIVELTINYEYFITEELRHVTTPTRPLNVSHQLGEVAEKIK